MAAGIDDLLAQGGRALTAGDFEVAERHFTEAQALAPAAPLPLFALAHLWHRRGGVGKAGLFAQKALAKGLSGEAADMASVWAGRLCLARGQREAGITLLARQAARFARMPPESYLDEMVGRDAMACAVCAGDDRLAERIFAAVSSKAVGLRLRCGATASLADWCARTGVPLLEIEPARDVVVPASSAYSRPYSYRTDPVQFASLSGAEWVPGWDFVIAPDGTVLGGSGYQQLTSPMAPMPHFYLADADLIIHPYPEECEHVDADVLFLSAPTSPNFGHWTIDFLPRLRGLDIVNDPDLKIAVPADLGAKQVETLALWGITEARLMRCRRGARYRFRTLHLLAHGQAMPPNPSNVAFVRARHYPPASTPPHSGPKRIFLARTSIGTRQVANRPEFEAFLAQEGFVPLEMADFSIAEQRERLSGAEILLGAFGTNLFALYFAPPGCTVIAMMDKAEHDPTIAPTAALVGMHHQFFLCAPAAERGRAYHAKDTDIVVDCAELKRRLDEIAQG